MSTLSTVKGKRWCHSFGGILGSQHVSSVAMSEDFKFWQFIVFLFARCLFGEFFDGIRQCNVSPSEGKCDAQSIPLRLHCPFENCHKSYNSKKHLNEHFRLHPSHKPHTLPSTRVRVTAKECAEKFLDDETNIFGKVNDQRQELLKKIGIESNVFGELVVGHVDVEKYITLFLSQTGTQSAINMDYTDGFPWLK